MSSAYGADKIELIHRPLVAEFSNSLHLRCSTLKRQRSIDLLVPLPAKAHWFIQRKELAFPPSMSQNPSNEDKKIEAPDSSAVVARSKDDARTYSSVSFGTYPLANRSSLEKARSR